MVRAGWGRDRPGGTGVEVSVRYEAMTAASQRFARGMGELDDILRAAQRALERAASATGDTSGTAQIVAFSDQLSSVLDGTSERLLDVAGGLKRTVDAIWSAGGGASGLDTPIPRRLGGPQ